MNTASRMESTCPTGCIHISADTRNLLVGTQWEADLKYTGGVQVKGKGMMVGSHACVACMVGGVGVCCGGGTFLLCGRDLFVEGRCRPMGGRKVLGLGTHCKCT